MSLKKYNQARQRQTANKRLTAIQLLITGYIYSNTINYQSCDSIFLFQSILQSQPTKNYAALSIEQCPSFRDQPLGSTATYNGKCYLFHNNQNLNFENARRYCEARGGTLVDETSPALQGFLSWELYRRHRNDQLSGQYWLGAVRDQRNGQNWKWISGKDVQISFWNTPATQANCSRFDGSKGWLWSDTDCNLNLNFICQYRPLSCGKPEKPTNSTLITRNVEIGTVIEYKCAPGNMLMGPNVRTCLASGFFSEFAPKCKYLDCAYPAMIANGDYKLINGTTSYQSVVNYACNEGYVLYGRSTLSCDVDERWNGPPPRCEPRLCQAPSPPMNGYVTVSSNVTITGTQATFDCRPGYELVGERSLTCSFSGFWDNQFPYCKGKLTFYLFMYIYLVINILLFVFYCRGLSTFLDYCRL